ncbi:MAG: CHAT domain-containing protein [Methanosarcina barkeri]|nr:CHAT domain-containing protein [Methanosarcina sp. ERenArc_MAG2]
MKSFIALAKTDKFSGHFRVSDVYDLNLQTELTILACCETGSGSVSGDGVDGLSRAFTQAGSSALLMSLWEIAEETTSLMIFGFHQFWVKGKMGKAVSLRNAQLEVLRTYRTQPNLWAGFVLFGDPN